MDLSATDGYLQSNLERYFGAFQISIIEVFAEIANSWKPLTIFTKSSISINVWQGRNYASALRKHFVKVNNKETKTIFMQGVLASLFLKLDKLKSYLETN